MSTNNGARPAPAANPAEQEPSTFRTVLRLAQQCAMIYFATQLAQQYLFPKAPVTGTTPGSPEVGKPTGTAGAPGVKTTPPQAVNPWLLPPQEARLAWPIGQPLDIHVYLSTTPDGDVFGTRENLPHFTWDNIQFGDWTDSRTVEYDVTFPKSVLNNGTLWADIFVTKDGSSPNPAKRNFDPRNVHHIRKLLTPYFPKPKVRREKSLLSAKEEVEEEETTFVDEPDVYVPHWHKNVTLALISEASVVPYQKLPPPVREHVHLVRGQRDETGTKGYYYPIVFPNEFWHLREHYIELNSTTTSLPVQFTFQPMSFLKFQMFASMTHGFNEAAKNGGGTSEIDELKRMLLETNPWFLGLTGLVSILHVVFEMLAFKSDVTHWRQKKEMVGVSVRTIITNVFVQIVVLLYLIDNNENTSWMILMGSGVGVVIEAWKITKAVDISVVPAGPGALFPYRLDIKDKHVLSEDEKKTQEYDRLAFRYVSYVAIPTLIGYTIYSLLYEKHKGWYSFVISTLTSYVYMFGFAQLVPQLIINYKLKSVAHMPMKAMIYKTLSTVVDDLFAFCIKMPFLHRLACFRDDVVFLIFLYQRWIYRIDPKRVNEYGQVMAEDVDAAEQIESKKTQ
ncbi:cleft lip and palate associated transmembrane protein [Coprinopsis cinerea okayama7|uniref:Cleft lip and palate associated transmembrane protein n=1 Tax=Coprinopsis cinerea (strain Okayama-7 / 130 / ATCC MYA-4618 / FGSC 9003) TaxID=240176 RepID=A8NYR8_COPC7|nr:cleft lip and palate associated transmembrane protein [Coprinopsis cinerea okayama7\|eukprot:XP_001837503.2 cleft lip and palate associated transmembrane protein [Coprinopsis cinerea okayama7\